MNPATISPTLRAFDGHYYDYVITYGPTGATHHGYSRHSGCCRKEPTCRATLPDWHETHDHNTVSPQCPECVFGPPQESAAYVHMMADLNERWNQRERTYQLANSGPEGLIFP